MKNILLLLLLVAFMPRVEWDNLSETARLAKILKMSFAYSAQTACKKVEITPTIKGGLVVFTIKCKD